VGADLLELKEFIAIGGGERVSNTGRLVNLSTWHVLFFPRIIGLSLNYSMFRMKDKPKLHHNPGLKEMPP